MVGFLNDNFVAGILEQLGHLVAFAGPTLGGEVGEGKPDLGIGGTVDVRREARDRRDRERKQNVPSHTVPP